VIKLNIESGRHLRLGYYKHKLSQLEITCDRAKIMVQLE
jgi:hypothetical protein